MRATLTRLLVNKPGEHEQHERQRDLQRDERVAEAQEPAPAGRLRRLRFHDRGRIGAPGRERRHQTEQHDRAERDGRREEHDGWVQDDLRIRPRAPARDRLDEAQRRYRGGDGQHSADEREHRRFGEQLRDEPAAARADRRANRHLAGARSAAREQQVRDVDAGDQQHEQRRAERERQPVGRSDLR